jgi:hypothetical protein
MFGWMWNMKSKKAAAAATAEDAMLMRIAVLAPRLSEFQRRAVALSVRQMLEASFFSICSFDSLVSTLGRAGRMDLGDVRALRDMHCVNWKDMGESMAAETRGKCLALLGLCPEEAECSAEDERIAAEQTKAIIRRLRV